MAKNRGFEWILEEDGDAASFYKILHGSELSSEHMRRIPTQFRRSLSDEDFKYRVVLKVAWGNSWSIPLSKLGGCICMETCGWEEFLRDNHLGDDELLVFTHQEKMLMNVKIFSKNGMKVIERPEPVMPPDARRSEPKDEKVKYILKEEELEYEISDVVDLHGRREHKGETGAQNKQANGPIMSTNKVQRPEFFKVLIPHINSEILHLPQGINRYISQPLSDTVVIRNHSGNSWRVGLTRRNSFVCFERGWTNFVQENELKEGEFMIFVYEAPKTFLVSIYGVSTCRETRAQVVTQEIHEEEKEERAKRYLENPANLFFTTKLKNRNYELLVPSRMVKDYKLKFSKHVTFMDSRGTMMGRLVSWRDKRVGFKRWNSICRRNKLKAEDRVICELQRTEGSVVDTIKVHIIREGNNSPKSVSFPQFIIEIKPSYTHFLMIPKRFAEKHLPKESMTMVMHGEEGKRWKVKYLYREKYMTLSAGWALLVREMGIKEGDWCILQLFNTNEMRVEVSKTCPTWVALT